MKVLILIFSILLILVSVFTAEYFIVEDFFDDLRSNAKSMKKTVLNGEINEKDASDIVKIWEDGKEKLFIFENHEYFKRLEEHVYDLKFSAKRKEERSTLYVLEKIIVLSDESEYDFSLMPGNIF